MMRTSSIIYKGYVSIGEGMGEPVQQLLTATEKTWRAG
jgi:hypothetical protein